MSGSGSLILSQVLEHERRAPDRAGGVGDLAGNIRRRAVHGLEDGRHVGAGSDVRARRHAHAALDRRGQVGEDVAEQVRGDDDVEARRVAHHAGGKRVDEHTFDVDAAEFDAVCSTTSSQST